MSFRVFEFEQEELNGKAFEVRINGEKVGLHTARVSAHPINRRWPGHQRTVDQSEITHFLSFEMDEPVEITVKPDFSFENVRVRPAALNDALKVIGGAAIIHLEKPAYFVVEFDDMHHALHVFAENVTDYAKEQAQGEILYYGKGFHDAGVIELKSNQTLWIDEGAVVYASVRADGADNIKIIGHGILDNSKNKEVILHEVDTGDGSMDVGNALREHTVQFLWCKNILIDGITIRDSLVYNIKPVCCEDVVVRNVKIIGCWRYNSDGIDMHNCKNVLIEHCFVRTFDDCICVKGFDWTQNPEDMVRDGESFDYFEDVLIRDCVLWNDWGKCLEIGAETRAEVIHNIRFENCDLIHLCGPALDIFNVDWADVYDVSFENIRIESESGEEAHMTQLTDEDVYPENMPKVLDPLVINLTIKKHPEYSAGGDRRGRIRNVSFKNIYTTSAQNMRISMNGYDADYRVQNVAIEGIYLNGIEIKDIEQLEFSHNNFVEDIYLIGKKID